MVAKGREFIERDDVREALGRLLDDCAAARDRGEAPSPDVAAFLRERCIEPHPDSPLKLHYSIEPVETAADSQAVPPDGSCV